MISSYNSAVLNLVTDEDFVFTTDRVVTGCAIKHSAGAAAFTLNKTGYYLITFNGDGATSDTAGLVSVGLYSNGVAVGGAEASGYSGAVTSVVNLGFSTIIKVQASCCCVDNTTVLTVKNTGIDATFDNANITITRLC